MKLTSILRLCGFLLLSGSVHAQSNNALAFDGVNDAVTVPGASALIANSAGMSLTCWVYPTNAAPSFPNFDGFAGIRNNTDADFYLLQFSATSVEARFRGTSGIAYDIVAPVLTLNAWNHLAFTYDGSYLRLFKNGVLADSLAASDVILNTNESMLIGDQLFSGTHYYLTGKMDEVSLWSRALQPAELVCMPVNGIDTSSATDLELYYRFNQGTASQNNSTITTLTDETGTINGTLSGFQMNGSTSNFVAGAVLITPAVAFSCPDVPYNWNGTNITTPGVYFDTLTSVAGCDSIVQLTLSLLSVNTSVTQSGATLTAGHVGLFYQWLDCNNGFAPITGATSQSFTPSVNGSYAVIVQQSGCFDTSACITVTNVSIAEQQLSDNISVYPAVTKGQIYLEMRQMLPVVTLQLFDMSGRKIRQEELSNVWNHTMDLSVLAAGVYQVRLTTPEGSVTRKVVKE
jgi:hypothetical protein